MEALLTATLDDPCADREIDPNGYINSIECRYCGFQTQHYEGIEYFAVQEFMP